MKMNIERSVKTGVLKLKGDLTIQTAGKLRQKLLKAGSASGDLVLDLEGVTEIDIPVLQLMCSLHRTMVKSRRQLGLSEKSQELLAGVIENAGLARHTGCVHGRSGICLWMKR